MTPESYDGWEVRLENTDAQSSFQEGLIEGVKFYRVEKCGMVEDFTDYDEAMTEYKKKEKEKC